mmetsp:Transcript_30259/g.69220  ORF Transcript_30259/g.69220 Transcript_30259/m.69220 type:complete len:234 (-) Transcript_30259:88-789(-)
MKLRFLSPCRFGSLAPNWRFAMSLCIGTMCFADTWVPSRASKRSCFSILTMSCHDTTSRLSRPRASRSAAPTGCGVSNPKCTAQSRGVRWRGVCPRTSSRAPLCRSSCTPAALPPAAAMCSGVHPSRDVSALTPAPLSRSMLSAAGWLNSAAACAGVSPHGASVALLSTPAAERVSSELLSPSAAARTKRWSRASACSGVLAQEVAGTLPFTRARANSTSETDSNSFSADSEN